MEVLGVCRGETRGVIQLLILEFFPSSSDLSHHAPIGYSHYRVLSGASQTTFL